MIRFSISEGWNVPSVLETIVTGLNMDAWYVVCARALLGSDIFSFPHSYNLLVTNYSNTDFERAVYWYVSAVLNTSLVGTDIDLRPLPGHLL